MTPWADEFAEWRKNRLKETSMVSPKRSQESPSVEHSPATAAAAAAADDEDWSKESGLQPDSSYQEEDVNGLEETKGCAILDSGATVMCSSTVAAEEIHMQRINRSEPGQPTVSKSDRRFRFADGRVDEAQKVVEQPIMSGLLAGNP